MRGYLILSVALAWLLAAGCGGQASSVNPGDTVQPVLDGFPLWSAGKTENLKVRLQVTSKGSSTPRNLDYNGLPADAHPQATVTFFIGPRPQEPLQVPLSHRCGEGLYEAGFSIPPYASKAKVVVVPKLSNPDIIQVPLEIQIKISGS